MVVEYKVHVTKYAYAQILEIKRYIACELQALIAAKNLLLAIKRFFAALYLAVMSA